VRKGRLFDNPNSQPNSPFSRFSFNLLAPIPRASQRSHPTGFHAAIYHDEKNKRYVLTFAGTEGLSWADWKNNLKQAAGKAAEQYRAAMQLALALKRGTNKPFVVIGHSLGGGLASAASIVSGYEAVTFNAAGLNAKTVADYKKDVTEARKLVRAYYVEGEALSALQDSTPAPDAVGRRIPLPPTRKLIRTRIPSRAVDAYNAYQRLQMHRIESVIEAMERLRRSLESQP